MKKSFTAIIVLFIFFIAFIRAGSAGSSEITGDCQEKAQDSANSLDTDSVDKNGYKLFPIEAPKRFEAQPNPRNELPEDKSFAESLRMLLGVGVPGNSNCPRKPEVRGLLKDY